MFYELYLKDFDGSLIDVPILIDNVGSDTGGYPNQETDQSRWILTRRFFIFDTISGIPQNEFPTPGEPSIVRYAN